ncbi:serine hydrolase [Undibacterium baiyunense]|uniref:Serine hydrolase n=1 Tax=Undibacterium baiyunense TaxID=2828731 RepID=A0A941DFU7_9BURK|nr:serine hydrolase [Undibacterium baiyunense]MBR7746868.1 serine hydrolase [Undibacterium baiyunense]
MQVKTILAWSVSFLCMQFIVHSSVASTGRGFSELIESAEYDNKGNFPTASSWKGTVNLSNGKVLVLDLRLAQVEKEWHGSISIPQQGAKDLKLKDIQIDGHNLQFSIADVKGTPTFVGHFDAVSRKIEGEFSQSGTKTPFSLTQYDSAQTIESLQNLNSVTPSVLPLLKDFEKDVEKIRMDWKVPGVAVVIVKGDQILFSRGFGLRNVDKQLPMTSDTLLPIGSASKAFTTAMMAVLVDEGKLAWDQPVRNWLPEFKLYDEKASERLTPLDLVTHRSGLPRHDALWYNAKHPRQDLVRRLRYLEPSKDLGSVFQYNNLLFMTAGYLTECITGQTWEDMVGERLLQPLGMARSNFSIEQTRQDSDFSQPYRLAKNGEPRQISFRSLGSMNPAGGLNTSANELSAWLRLHLNNGRHIGKQVLSADIMQMMQKIHIRTGEENSVDVKDRSYAVGWFSDIYRGHVRLHHGGKIDGFSSMVTLLPQEGIGVAVLSNLEGSPIREFITRNALDRLLKLEVRDNSALALQRKVVQKEDTNSVAKSVTGIRKVGTQTSQALSSYVGKYEHPAYGVVTVSLQQDRLQLVLNDNRTLLTHWHYDSFVGDVIEDGDSIFANQRVQFFTDRNGDIASLHIELESSVKDIVFTREKEANAADAEFLRRFTGTFTFDGNREFKIGLQDKSLYAEMVGRPRYVLQLVSGYRFELQGLRGYGIEFKLGKDGRFDQAELIRPNDSSQATRKHVNQ